MATCSRLTVLLMLLRRRIEMMTLRPEMQLNSYKFTNLLAICGAQRT